MEKYDYKKTLINLKNIEHKIILNGKKDILNNADIEKYKLDPRKVRRVIYGEIKVLNDEWILEENYEEYISTNEICKICYKGFKNIPSLRNHLKRQHDIKQKDFYKFCNVKKTDRSQRKKPIDQLDKNTGKIIRTWDSALDAAKELNIREGCIRNAAIGKLLTYKKFIWEFHKEEEKRQKNSFEKLKGVKEKRKKILLADLHKNKKRIIDIDLLSETKDILEKAIKDICRINRRAVINNNPSFFKSHKGLFYFYKDDYLHNEEKIIKLYNSMPVECKECGARFQKSQPLTSHIFSTHNMSVENYTIKHYYKGHRPSCKSCNNKTRYTSFSFKDYCIEHSRQAMSIGGNKGGQAPAWSKGLTKEDDERLMEYSEKYSGEGNPFYGKKHTEELKQKMSELKKLTEQEIIERLKSREDDFNFEFDYNDYYSRQHQKINCICKECTRSQEKTLQALERGSLCKFCYPFVVSKAEIEIGDFIENDLGIKNIIRNDRKVIAPKELDIYLPDYNIAIEYNGLYWHGELNKEDRYFHYKKNQDCLEKGINLITVDEDHWRDQKDLIKSMIRHAVKMSNNKVYARKCIVEKTKNEQRVKDFFNKNHISGHANSMQVFLLVEKNTKEIVAGLSLRKAFHKKYKEYMEIGRFATRQNTTIPGAFTKLLKQAIKHVEENFPEKKGIVSYCDLAFGNGNVYDKNGFTKIIRSKSKEINFFYTDGKKRFNRFDFRAQPGKTEKQVAAEAGVYKIYGCGNSLYELRLKK